MYLNRHRRKEILSDVEEGPSGENLRVGMVQDLEDTLGQGIQSFTIIKRGNDRSPKRR